MLGLSCGTEDLRPFLRHVGSSSLTRDQIQAPLHGELRVLVTAPPGEVPRLALFEVWLADSDLQEDTDLE